MGIVMQGVGYTVGLIAAFLSLRLFGLAQNPPGLVMPGQSHIIEIEACLFALIAMVCWLGSAVLGELGQLVTTRQSPESD